MWPLRVEVADVQVFLGPYAPKPFDRFIATISRSEDSIAWFVIACQTIASLHRARNVDASRSQRDCRYVDVFDQVFADSAFADARSMNDEWNVRPFVV